MNLLINELQDGLLYTIMITNISKDWESGFVDGYDLEFKEIKSGVQDANKV